MGRLTTLDLFHLQNNSGMFVMGTPTDIVCGINNVLIAGRIWALICAYFNQHVVYPALRRDPSYILRYRCWSLVLHTTSAHAAKSFAENTGSGARYTFPSLVRSSIELSGNGHGVRSPINLSSFLLMVSYQIHTRSIQHGTCPNINRW